MKAIIQRVLKASVTVDGKVVSSIGKGILVLAAVAPQDTQQDVDFIVNKILKLKMWDDESNGGRWKKSLMDLDYQVLLVSQFTLYANIKKGSKPDFHGACPPALAKDIYASLLEKTREAYAKEKKFDKEESLNRVQDGVFGAMMEVMLVNDGPVTFDINSPPQEPATEKGAKPAKAPKAPRPTKDVKGALAKEDTGEKEQDGDNVLKPTTEAAPPAAPAP